MCFSDGTPHKLIGILYSHITEFRAGCYFIYKSVSRKYTYQNQRNNSSFDSAQDFATHFDTLHWACWHTWWHICLPMLAPGSEAAAAVGALASDNISVSEAVVTQILRT
jgi:hypothetical protein